MNLITMFNTVIMFLFFISYSYQFFYTAVSLLSCGKPRRHRILKFLNRDNPADGTLPGQAETPHRIAVLIAARNERDVIGNLLESIGRQNYPGEYLDVYVGADNCTDDTADIARAYGVSVFERRDAVNVGKGYVLNFLLKKIAQSGCEKYDAYLVLDADNILDPGFVGEMNRSLSEGNEIITCYRNSKNYGDSWISAGCALWFLREARYLSGARAALGNSCAVSGTGFLFSDRVLREAGGWNYYLLTEDIEFSVDSILRGTKIGYAPGAVLYDEQPVSFSQSWRQRLRWSKGNFQVFLKYRRELLSGILRGSFSCYDMTMNVMPAAILTGVSVIVNLGAAVCGFLTGGSLAFLGQSVLRTLANVYLAMFAMGALTTATEWKNIYCPARKKLLYAFTFPLFMLTYIPICIAALFVRPQWKPIWHRQSLTLEQIKERA